MFFFTVIIFKCAVFCDIKYIGRDTTSGTLAVRQDLSNSVGSLNYSWTIDWVKRVFQPQ